MHPPFNPIQHLCTRKSEFYFRFFSLKKWIIFLNLTNEKFHLYHVFDVGDIIIIIIVIITIIIIIIGHWSFGLYLVNKKKIWTRLMAYSIFDCDKIFFLTFFIFLFKCYWWISFWFKWWICFCFFSREISRKTTEKIWPKKPYLHISHDDYDYED